MYMHTFILADLYLSFEFVEAALEQALALTPLQVVHLSGQVLALLCNQPLRQLGLVSLQLTQSVTEGGDGRELSSFTL